MLLAEYSAAFFVFSAAISLIYKGVKNKDFGGKNRIFGISGPTIFGPFWCLKKGVKSHAFLTLFLRMPRPLFVVVLLFLVSSLSAQQRVPVFGTQADSAEYARTEDLLYKAMQNPRFSFRIDSLSRSAAKLREKAVRYRTIYRASSLYTRYDQRPKDLSTVTRLSLADYKGKSLPDSLFLMTNLKELELVNTRIGALPARLAEFPNLTKVTLLNNRPRRRLKLAKNKTVTDLSIQDDELDLRPRTYRKYSSLKSLDLSRNNLTRFPTLRGTSKLRRLVLTDNQLTLEDLRRGLPKLEELVMTTNKVRHLPPVVGQFTGLRKLNLNANQIETLPKEIGALQNLEQLSLYKNNVARLPREIYQLRNLHVIDLYYNQLEELDSAIRNWSKLEILYVANNKLYTLPDNLGSLTALRELYLHHNRISVLPASAGSLDSLRVLRVNNNLVLEFPSVLTRLRSLENLDIASNQMTSLPQELFELPHLRILSLKGNPFDRDARTKILEWSRKAMTERPVMIHLEGLAEVSAEGNRP
jgi:Leucine-rich repeat (LRR) protein